MNTQILVNNIGNKRGRFSNKSARVAKLIDRWPELYAKLIGMIERGKGLTEASRLAYGLLLMLETGVRIGNETSAEGWTCINQIVCRKDNPTKGLKVGDVIWRHPSYGQHVQTYGLTTLLHNHVRRYKNKISINFVGKKLVDQSLYTRHPTLIKYCPRGNANELFLGIDYYTLKKFVKKSVGKNYTPKDLRMTKVNLLFIEKFGNDPVKKEFANATTKSGKKKILSNCISEVAAVIGHTPSVCRSAYLSQPLINFITESM